MKPIGPSAEEMERASRSNDASYDGVFYVCVRTTGIFCRPSCPAKKPLRRNMIFHRSPRDCLLDGYRPCKRCRPLAARADDDKWIDPLLLLVEQAPAERITDADIARLGISPYRVRRFFTRNMHMTFQAYHRARRMGLALKLLRSGENCAAVAHDHSYGSLSGFRDAFKRTFGATPRRIDGLECIHTTRLESPLGPLVVGATAEGICLLEFADRRALQRQVVVLRKRFNAAVIPGRNDHFDQLAQELREYFEGMRRAFTVPLVARGTPFQEQVWDELRRIPFGLTTSYSKLATAIGRPGAQRAVGRANGDNRVAVLIPCHRVVRDDGSLCGYGGGLWRKQFLLDLERAVQEGRERPRTAMVERCVVG